MHSSARMQCDNIRAGRKRGVKWERFLNPEKTQVKYWFQTWKQFLVRMNGWYWVLSRKEPTSLESMKSLRNISSILLRTLFMWFVNPKSPVHVHWETEKGSLQGVKRKLPACKNHRERPHGPERWSEEPQVITAQLLVPGPPEDHLHFCQSVTQSNSKYAQHFPFSLS